MRTTQHTFRPAALVAIGALAIAALTGCSSTSTGDTGEDTAPADGNMEVIAPVTMSVEELSGANVELLVEQALNIDTGDHEVEHFSGAVVDPMVAEFVPGDSSGGAVFNPGVLALAPGTTTVTVTDAEHGDEEITFTVIVTEG